MKRLCLTVALGAAALTLSLLTPASAGPLPDLKPIAPRLLHGFVSVQNDSAVGAGASIATVKCVKVGHVGPGGGCPDLPPMPEYTDPAFPDAVAVHIPRIAPHHVYSVKLKFWPKVKWPKGSYTLTLTVDAGAAVAESNEGNNVDSAVLVSP